MIAKYAAVTWACGMIGYCTGARYFEPPDPREWVTEARTALYGELVAQRSVRERTGQWSTRILHTPKTGRVTTAVAIDGFTLILQSRHRRLRHVVCELRYTSGIRLTAMPSHLLSVAGTRPDPFPADGRPFCYRAK